MTVPNQSQTRWGYIAEVTPNTTPATPAFQVVRPRAGSSLKINRPRVESTELRPDRKLGSTFGGVGGGTGRLPTLLFHETFQHDMLEAAMFGTWDEDLLLDGVTAKFKTFERRMAAGANNVFDRLTGTLVNGMSMSVVPNQECTVDYELLAMGGATASAIISGATYVDPEVGQAADYADVSGISLFGLTNFSLVGLTLGIMNNLSGQPKLGTRDLLGLRIGPCRIRVTADVYLEDAASYAAALANTVGEVAFTLGPVGGSAGARYTFTIPSAEIGDHTASDSTGDGILSLSAVALMNETLTAQMSIERNQ